MVQRPKTKGYSICPFVQGETITMKVLNGAVLAPHICINFVYSFPTEFRISNRISTKTFTHFHEDVNIHIWFDASFFLSSADFLHQFCRPQKLNLTKSKNGAYQTWTWGLKVQRDFVPPTLTANYFRQDKSDINLLLLQGWLCTPTVIQLKLICKGTDRNLCQSLDIEQRNSMSP